jgi:hypothetical protein
MKQKLEMVVLFGLALACASKRDGNGTPAGGGEGGETAAGGRGGAGGKAGSGGRAGNGQAGEAEAGHAGASGADSASAGSGGAGGTRDPGEAGSTGAGMAGDGAAGNPEPEVERVPLPEGSRERGNVVNLVDADAAAGLAEYLAEAPGITKSLNLFLKYYEELYDLVYVYTDHDVGTRLAGRYVTVTRPASVGTGLDYDTQNESYTSNGRTWGVIGINYRQGYFGPLAHEMVHQWANFLDTDFGFGAGLPEHSGPHWGYAGFKGVLGGFDQSTLECVTPAGGTPPSCTAESNGRYRYRVGAFAPGGNTVAAFAPLELYLMGLIKASELPSSLIVLEEGEQIENSYDSSTGKLVVEAKGIRTIATADIIERHGTVRELPASERAFTAAFVVVSATPASDAVMDAVDFEAAAFGAREQARLSYSFEAQTGGRATLDTRLGPRRAVGDPGPPLMTPFYCDFETQDCESGKACYYNARGGICGIPRGGERDEPCTESAHCAKGLGCAENLTTGNRACEPYCSANGADTNGCFTWCGSGYYFLPDEDGLIIAGICEPPP